MLVKEVKVCFALIIIFEPLVDPALTNPKFATNLVAKMNTYVNSTDEILSEKNEKAILKVLKQYSSRNEKAQKALDSKEKRDKEKQNKQNKRKPLKKEPVLEDSDED